MGVAPGISNGCYSAARRDARTGGRWRVRYRTWEGTWPRRLYDARLKRAGGQ